MWLCVVGSGDAATYRAFVLCLLLVCVLTDIVQTTTSEVCLERQGGTCWGKEASVLKYATEVHYGRCRI